MPSKPYRSKDKTCHYDAKRFPILYKPYFGVRNSELTLHRERIFVMEKVVSLGLIFLAHG
jgi:hypothetical protein